LLNEDEGMPWKNKDGKPLAANGGTLPMSRCPHCNIASPLLQLTWSHQTSGIGGQRNWRVYACTTCGGLVLTGSSTIDPNVTVQELYPALEGIDAAVPERARAYLHQATEGLAQAAASVIMSASAIDAMLKAKGRISGTLYERIDKAASDHLITQDMAKWAHQVRLDANDQRHADDSSPLPTVKDAQRSLDFALALAEFLFVLPARVTRGLAPTVKPTSP
jgi:hypothetical protein